MWELVPRTIIYKVLLTFGLVSCSDRKNFLLLFLPHPQTSLFISQLWASSRSLFGRIMCYFPLLAQNLIHNPHVLVGNLSLFERDYHEIPNVNPWSCYLIFSLSAAKYLEWEREILLFLEFRIMKGMIWADNLWFASTIPWVCTSSYWYKWVREREEHGITNCWVYAWKTHSWTGKG